MIWGAIKAHTIWPWVHLELRRLHQPPSGIDPRLWRATPLPLAVRRAHPGTDSEVPVEHHHWKSFTEL